MLDILAGALTGAAEGIEANRDNFLKRAQQRAMLGAAKQSLVKDLFATPTLPELQTKIDALESSGLPVSQETRGRAIQNLTFRELAAREMENAALASTPESYGAAMMEAARYMTKTNDLPLSASLQLYSGIQADVWQRKQRQLVEQERQLIGDIINPLRQEVSAITSEIDDPSLAKEAVSSTLLSRAKELGLPVSPGFEEAITKLPPPVVNKLLDKLQTETNFDGLEQALQAPDRPAALRQIASYLATPTQQEPDEQTPVAQQQRRPDLTLDILKRQEEALRRIATINPTDKAIQDWATAAQKLQTYAVQQDYAPILEQQIKTGMQQYGETDPLGIIWSPRAKQAAGLQATIRAMTDMIQKLSGDPSEAAREMTQKLQNSMSQLTPLLESTAPVKLTPEIRLAVREVMGEHYNPNDPVHLAQLFSSPNTAAEITRRAEDIKINLAAQHSYETELAKEKASAQVKPTEYQVLAAEVTGKPVGSPITPEDAKKIREYSLQLDLQKEAAMIRERESAQSEFAKSVEDAARTSLIYAGIQSWDFLKKHVLKVKNGKVTVDRVALAKYAVNLPGSEGRAITSRATQAFWSVMRPETGAEVRAQEEASYIRMYGLSTLDSDATIIDKIRNLDSLLHGTLALRDPTGKLTERLKAARLDPGSPEAKKYVDDLVRDAQKELGGRKKK